MAVLALVATAILTLSACSTGTGTSPRIALLEREQTSEDRLPQSVPTPEYMELDPGSTRLAVAHDGIAYYLASAQKSQSACLYAVAQTDPEQFIGACGGLGFSDEIMHGTGIPPVGSAGSYTMVADNADVRHLVADGWEQIHPNILIKG